MKKNTHIDTIEAPTPSYLNETNEDYNPDDVLRKGYFYLYKKKYVFSKAILSIYVKDSKDKFNWVVWVKIPAKSFIEMAENVSNKTGRIKGVLVSSLLFYEIQDGMKIELEFDTKSKEIKLPAIVHLENMGELQDHFTEGMPKLKYQDLQKSLSNIRP